MSALQSVKRRLSEIFLHENWMIGVIDQPISNAPGWTACPPVRWLSPRSSRRYFADPFPWPGSPNTILCENYDFTTGHGSIVRLRLANDRVVAEEAERFDLPGHMSFPYLFQEDGFVYVLPESAAARELVLFRWDAARDRWEKIATPLKGVAASDSVLFTFGGRYWIAYTDNSLGNMDNLNLLYADTLQGEWRSHKANPVVCGLKTSRCGGTPFYVGSALYRPAQDCTRGYGKALRIMKIVECSEYSYREEEATVLCARPGENPDGLHTLSAWGERCLVDGKRMMFSPQQVLNKIIRRIRRLGYVSMPQG